MSSNASAKRGSTVDAAAVRHFSALAAQWWDQRGPMAVLHKFNPVRLGFILDIGCGAGILSEPLARLGADVMGADPSEANIAAAKMHAADTGVIVDYRITSVEALADVGELFDVVLAMEVVEHVADLNLFVKRCAEMVKPGGLMITATINRTLESFALAIVGAEYVLRWLPRGTHEWDKFVTPNELEAALERYGLRAIDETGVIYNILADRWQLSNDMDVNYIVTAENRSG